MIFVEYWLQVTCHPISSWVEKPISETPAALIDCVAGRLDQFEIRICTQIVSFQLAIKQMQKLQLQTQRMLRLTLDACGQRVALLLVVNRKLLVIACCFALYTVTYCITQRSYCTTVFRWRFLYCSLIAQLTVVLFLVTQHTLCNFHLHPSTVVSYCGTLIARKINNNEIVVAAAACC